MGFNIGLSGLRAATSDLNVTGNNIANAGTAGFKQSRAEFADVYASSVLGSGSKTQGSGVVLGDVSQLFKQGNINGTQNALDLAIDGNGFFQTSNNGAVSYTRAGYFGTDRNGFLVNNFGYNLQGYGVDAAGNLQNGIVGDLRIDTANQAPRATERLDQVFNLNSNNQVPVVRQGAFNASIQGAVNAWLVGNAVDPANPTPAEQAAAQAAVAADPAAQAAAQAAGLGALADAIEVGKVEPAKPEKGKAAPRGKTLDEDDDDGMPLLLEDYLSDDDRLDDVRGSSPATGSVFGHAHRRAVRIRSRLDSVET